MQLSAEVKSSANHSNSYAGTTLILLGLIAIYAAARVLQLYHGKVPLLLIVALHVFPPAIFAFVHGSMLYRLRGMVAFACLCLAVGNIFENVGILTGFPFGSYYFTDAMGPKLFRVPVLLGLAYVGMGYLSWAIGRIILGDLRKGDLRNPLTGLRLVTLPVVSAFVMVAWDLSADPVWSTIMHAWIWREGGPYFGVPVSNFLGWYLTVYIFYQLFALYLRGRSPRSGSLPRGYWQLAILFYAASAAGNILLTVPRPGLLVISDATGTLWKVTDITHACALVSIFTMGAFAVLASVRLTDSTRRSVQT